MSRNDQKIKRAIIASVAVFTLFAIAVCTVSAAIHLLTHCDTDDGIAASANYFSVVPGFFFVHTYGDSITDAGTYGKIMDYSTRFDSEMNNYQRHFYQYLHARNAETSVLNFGIGGELTKQIVSRYLVVSDVTPVNTTVIFMAGTNDILGYAIAHGYLNVTHISNAIINEYKKAIAISQKRGHRVFICSVPPMSKRIIMFPNKDVEWIAKGIVEINARISTFAKNTFCDIHGELIEPHYAEPFYMKGISMDGIHLYARGNLILGQGIARCIVNKI